MLKRILDWVNPPPIRRATELESLLERQAARLVTSSTINFCRVKAAGNATKLFAEEPFRTRLEACRWEAYALILADFLRVAEALLRSHAPAEDLHPRLVAAYAATLERAVRPADPAAGWAPHVEALRGALARAMLAPPAAAHTFGHASGRAIFALLPIHQRLRRDDREVVVNQIRFATVSLHQELERRLDAAAVAADYRNGDDARAGGQRAAS